MLAVAFLCGGLFTATGQEDSKSKPKRLSVEKVKQIQREAEKGDPVYQYILAVMYERGNQPGITANYDKVFHWCLKSANQGFGEAQKAAALMYYQDVIVNKNLVESLAWILLAQSNGVPLASNLASLIEKELAKKEGKESVKQAQDRAEEIQKEIAQNKKDRAAQKIDDRFSLKPEEFKQEIRKKQ